MFDVAQPASRSDSASIYSSSNSTLPPVDSHSPSSQAPSGNESKTPICPPAPPTREQTCEADSSTSENDADEDADDTADDEATGLAGEAQAAGNTAAEIPERVARNADHNVRVRAKEAIAANEKTEPQANGDTSVDDALAESK